MALLTITLALLLLGTVQASNHLVLSSASGTQSGAAADGWANAYTNLPATLTRGDTYYIGDGTYTGHVFNETLSGTNLVSVAKATLADHVTETGWSNSYTNQATFTSASYDTFQLSTSYILINGGYGTSTNTHGFKVLSTGTGDGEIIGISSGGTKGSIYLWNIEIAGQGVVTTNSTQFYRGYSGTATAATDVLEFRNCFVHDVYIWISTAQAKNALIDHCYLRNAGSDWPDGATNYWNTPVNYHAAGLTIGGTNVTVSFTIFENMVGGHNTTYIEPQFGPQNISIYGDIFWEHGSGVGTTQEGISLAGNDWVFGMPIYNCTFDGLAKPGVRGQNNGSSFASTGVDVFNNIFQDCGNTVSFVNINSSGSNTLNTGVASFVNTSAGDFHLAAPLSGTGLSALYNTDLDGVTRGADGVWDIGAFEYGSSALQATKKWRRRR